MTTPAELARLLGISSDPDGYNLEPFTDEEDMTLVSSLQRMPHGLDPSTNVFWTQFVASYLPQFVYSYVNRTIVFPGAIPTYTVLFACAVRHGAGFGHFVRTRETDFASLWTTTVKRISLADTERLSFDLNGDHETILDRELTSLQWLIRLWEVLYLAATTWLPVGFVLPLPASATVVRLRELLPFLSSDPRWEALDDSILPPMEHFIVYADHVVNKEVSLTLTSARKEELLLANRRWYSCEALVDEIVKEGSCSVRKTAEDRERMFMCGRCQSVRYCSPAHQKRHWKTHKPLCFKPLW